MNKGIEEFKEMVEYALENWWFLADERGAVSDTCETVKRGLKWLDEHTPSAEAIASRFANCGEFEVWNRLEEWALEEGMTDTYIVTMYSTGSLCDATKRPEREVKHEVSFDERTQLLAFVLDATSFDEARQKAREAYDRGAKIVYLSDLDHNVQERVRTLMVLPFGKDPEAADEGVWREGGVYQACESVEAAWRWLEGYFLPEAKDGRLIREHIAEHGYDKPGSVIIS